jgi:hypothetical protein
MAPIDIKQRYSLYVPKPLSRINLGDWQKRDSQSPKFGYGGVSIQSEASFFVDVTKGSYIQAKGGFVAQTTDWLQCSKNAMYMATSDSATLGVDGVVTVVAGAGQAPTWTLDHGDSLDPYPYNNLQLHYRVEEIQNSLFEFFRGRRQKDDPFKDVTAVTRAWELYKQEVSFHSATQKHWWSTLPGKILGAKEGDTKGAETEKELRGGFELLIDRSWQELYGKDKWDHHETEANAKYKPGEHPKKAQKFKKVAPLDLFDGIGDVRADPDPRTAGGDVDANSGSNTEALLKYGFSGYFSRFDPYLLLDPDAFKYDLKLDPFEKILCVGLAYLNNFVVGLKRTVDVLFKMASVIKDNALMKVVQNAAAAVDGTNGAIKTARGWGETWEAVHLGSRGNLRDQFVDEKESGVEKRGKLADKLVNQTTNKTTAQAQVRSGVHYKNPNDSNDKKGFYGGSRQLANGDTLTIVYDGGTFTTPPLSLAAVPAVAAVAATSATITGGAATQDGFTIAAGSWVQIQLDDGAWVKVDLTAQTIASVATEQAKDTALVAGNFPAHFVADRAQQVATLQQTIANAVGSRAVVANGTLSFASTITGTASKVRLFENPAGTLAKLGVTTASATGTAEVPAKAAVAAREAKDVTAAELVALFNLTPGISGKLKFSAEDEQVVITSEKKGEGSKVEVSGAMATSLEFVGEFRGESSRDEIRELDEGRRRLDDFNKGNEELQKLPDDAANLVRPVILLCKSTAGVVSKAQTMVKAAVKLLGVKLPSAKGSIGLIANKGISLGTPDRIVGVGGQGILFVSDGGTGNPDKAKYMPMEDIFNRILGADLLAKYEEPKVKPTLGFRVFSDTTVDLTAKTTANLLALGREKQGNDVVGCGVARVAGSRGVEIVGREKVVIGARVEDRGRVEVLGSTIALGYTQMDADAHEFGIGWKTDLQDNHPQTAQVAVHSTDQACILVGKYMVQLRAQKKADTTLTQAQADADNQQLVVQGLTADIVQLNVDKGLKVTALALARRRKKPAIQDEINDLQQAIDDKTDELEAAQKLLVVKQKVVIAAQKTNDEGVIISMRDPADASNIGPNHWAWKEKPSIVLSDKGVTITTTTGKDDDAKTARITLDDTGISIHVGDKKAGVLIKKDSVELSNGKKKAILKNDGTFTSSAAKIDFSEAQKITLG